jgi:hypothetical protein
VEKKIGESFFFHWDDGGESNGTFAFGVFRLALKRFSMENRFGEEIFD